MLWKSIFLKRPKTSTRQYHTVSGLTNHQQLVPEYGRSPRRQKLAVKIPRAAPCSRLIASKWYTHIHQVKMKTWTNGVAGWSKLRSTRLIKILRRTFAQNYHPRSNDYKQHFRSKVSNTTEGGATRSITTRLRTGTPKSSI